MTLPNIFVPLKDHEVEMIMSDQVVYKIFIHPRFSNGNLLVILGDVDVVPKKTDPFLNELRKFGDVFSFGIEKEAYEIIKAGKALRVSKIPGSPVVIMLEKKLQEKSLDRLKN